SQNRTYFSRYLRNQGPYLQTTTSLDSAHQIGLSTLLKDVLTVEEGVCGWRFKNCEIWDVFNYYERTSIRMAKRTTPLYSAHRIRASTLSKDVLTVDGGVCR